MAQSTNPWSFQVEKKVQAAGGQHGRPLDVKGKTIFKSFNRNDGTTRPTDALLIGELKDTYVSIHTRARDPSKLNGSVPEPLVITTPNADYLPFINLGQQIVINRRDGRWGPHDWTQWPQWFFEDYDHLPYIRRRPAEHDMATHPFGRIWWNMTENDFVEESGGGLTGVGRLRAEIASELYGLREELMKEVDNCHPSSDDDLRKLTAASTTMRYSTATLLWTPQTYPNVLHTVVAAQRYYLETRALLDKIRINDNYSLRKPHLTDLPFMGSITEHVSVAWGLIEKGVPVWLVQPPADLPPDTNIGRQAALVDPHPSLGVVMERVPHTPVFYSGPLSPGIYFATGTWRPGTIDLSRINPGGLPPATENSAPPATQAQTSTVVQQVLTTASTSAMSAQQKTPVSNRVPSSKPNYGAAPKANGPRANINFDRFKQSASPFSTITTPAWNQALMEINTDHSRLVDHPQRLLFRGYGFPDPPAFLAGGEKGTEVVLAWLVIRVPWMSTFTGVESRQFPLPSPQQWREYLREIALDYELVRQDRRNPVPSHRTAPKSRTGRRHQKGRDSARDIFTIQKPARGMLTSITWNGHSVWSPGAPDLQIVDHKLVVWDAHEHNFRLEMFNLDRCIMATDWANPDGQVAREEKLLAVFFEEVACMVTPPPGIKTIASADPQERCKFVEAFRLVLMDWPGEGATLLRALQFHKRVGDKDIWDFDFMLAVEKRAYSFYCQTFFDYFGRAPTVPHTLPFPV